jgi:hypothetical protein
MTPHEQLEQLITRILDAEPPDWSALDAAYDGDDRRLDALRTLADVATAFRRFDSAETDDAPLFRWGHLAVIEKVADGASSEVYRARDSGLGLDVALKLLKRDAAAQRAGTFLDEARKLAKVRHRNVLCVFGAAVHDGRPGLWCEWVEGRSLARQVADNGPFGAEETAVAGIALCRALGAVHAAGLLHGDVKPDNVLRERGGRLVLADLGAGGEPASVNASLRTSASPAYLAPEVLHGGVRTPQQDLYALGGLLQFLLTGSVPDPARAGADFDRHDVPAPLRAVIARARAADPSMRFASSDEIASALASSLREADPIVPARNERRGSRLLAVAALLLSAVIVVAVLMRSAAPPAQRELELVRHDGANAQVIADGAPVALGERLSFAFQTSEPAWLYVYNEDDRGVLKRLFPLPELDTANPLPANQRIEIPGRWQGSAMRFEVSSKAAAEEFLIVASSAPIALLETSGSDGAIGDAELRARGTGRLVPATPGVASTRLTALAERLGAEPSRIKVWRYRLPHREP